jgi:hypothetical protein
MELPFESLEGRFVRLGPFELHLAISGRNVSLSGLHVTLNVNVVR